MKTLQIALFCLISIVQSVNLYSQDKIFVKIDGNASENGKNLAMNTIISTINQSQYFESTISNIDNKYMLNVTINRGNENFDFLFKVTNKTNEFNKTYTAFTKSGYEGFEDVIKNTVKQILSELPKTNQKAEVSNNQQQPVNDSEQQPVNNNNNQPVNNVIIEANQNINDNVYTPPTTQSETTLIKGVELQGDFVIGSSIGANYSINYRFMNKFAFGIGSGMYFGDEVLLPFFIHGIWNITETKLSPFVELKVGFCPHIYTYTDYYYNEYGYLTYEDVTDVGLYGLLGIVGGVQYSFNNSLAIKTSFYLETTNIGFGVGLIYHFKSKTK